MRELLSNICDKLIKQSQQSDIWTQQICGVKLQNSTSLCHLFPSLIEETLLCPNAFIRKTKHLVILAILYHLSPTTISEKTQIQNIIQSFYDYEYSSIPICSVALASCLHLINNGSNSFTTDRNYSDIYPVDSDAKNNLEIAVLSLLLAIINKDNADCIQEFIRYSEKCVALIDEKYGPIFTLWIREEDFCFEDILLQYFLVVCGLTYCNVEEIPETWSVSLRREINCLLAKQGSEISAFTMALLLFCNKSLPDYSTCPTSSLKNKNSHVAISSSKEMLIAITTVGKNTGIGYIKRGKVVITNVGPHFFPLGEMDHFGIFHNPTWREKPCSLKSQPFHIKSWISLPSIKFNTNRLEKFIKGDIEMELEVEQKECGIDIAIRLIGPVHSNKLAFTFFLQASELITGDMKLEPYSLNRYQGINRPIRAVQETDFIAISPSFIGEMQIFSLAGKNHFWGSQFLLAYSLVDEDRRYHWNITY